MEEWRKESGRGGQRVRMGREERGRKKGGIEES